MQSEEFSNYAKLRNGVETVPANIRKNYRLDKLPRGKQRWEILLRKQNSGSQFQEAHLVFERAWLIMLKIQYLDSKRIK